MLPANDGPDDLHAGHAGNVTDDVVELQVHECQSLLHVLDMRRGVIQMPLAQPQVGPQGSNVAGRPEARTEQPARVQPLKPLGIIDVALAAGDGTRFSGVRDDDFQPMLLQNLVDRNPVDARGFHRDRFNPYRYQPAGHSLNVASEGLEGLHRLVAQIGRNPNDMEPRPDVDARCAVMDDGQPRRLGSLS